MPNQNIKKEIKKHLYMILNLAGVKKSIADKVVPVGVEGIIDDVVREAFERFIEETMVDYETNAANLPKLDLKSRGWNKCVDAQIKKQAKWLKENLN